MKRAVSYKVLQLKIDDIFRYSINKNGKIIIENAALKNLLYTMLSFDDKTVIDTNKLTAENIAKAAAISMPYNAAMRQIYLVNESNVTKDRYEISLEGPKNNSAYYLRILLYIDMNSYINNLITDEWRRQLYENGITLCFDDSEKDDEFILFERSASQQRQNILVMINKVFYGEETDVTPLKERIRCGLEDTDADFRVITSKYAAYRALMLTSGVCINTRKNGSDLLNRESVIVIDDYNIGKWQKLCMKYGYDITDKCSDVKCASINKETNTGNNTMTFKESDNTPFFHKVTGEKLFDGEGLVSVEMSEYISEELRSKNDSADKQYNSFQIRMPFVKGVLHKVDFHSILEDIFNDTRDNIFISDFYGNRHRLSDVKIILPLSMFKMYKNYKDIKNTDNSEHNTNGWNVYWDNFAKGEHCLLISNTDDMFRSSADFTISNYQFLSTLNEKNSDNDELLSAAIVAPSLNALYSVKNSFDSLAVSAVLMERTVPDDAEEKSEDSQCINGISKNDIEQKEVKISDAMLVSRCPSLIKTSSFRSRLSTDTLEKELSYGHLIEPGIMRYLSGDLMQMMCQLADMAYIRNENGETLPKTDTFKENIKNYLEEALDASRNETEEINRHKIYYYAPGHTTNQAIIDRNPHLTRNEHVFADPLPPKKNSLREKYFGHLKGVVMIQSDAHLALQRLGGADFDGDIARLFFDKAYIRAASACLTTDPLLIPSGEKPEPANYNTKEKIKLIERASGNNVGVYSNYAFRTSLFTYASRNTQKNDRKCINTEAQNDLILLSCAIGLEIDSVKTGIRPSFEKKKLEIFKNSPDHIKGGKKDPYSLTYFLGYKEYVKTENKDLKKPPKYKLIPINENYCEFSLVENLPYIFSPYRLEVDQDYKADSWAENCREILYTSKIDSSVQDSEDNVQTDAVYDDDDSETEEINNKSKGTERIFTSVKDEYISKKAKSCSIASLLEGFNQNDENIRVDDLFIDAYFAVRNQLYNSTRSGNAEANKKFEIIRKILIRRYGNYYGTILADELADNRMNTGTFKQVSHILYSLIEWKNLPFAEMRKSRFESLAYNNSIMLSDSLIAAFDEYCCKLSSDDPDSYEFAKLLLCNKYEDLIKLQNYKKQNNNDFDMFNKKYLLFENDININNVDKDNIIELLGRCFRSINFSANLKELAKSLKDDMQLSVKELKKICNIYSVNIPQSSINNDDHSITFSDTKLIDKYYEFYGVNSTDSVNCHKKASAKSFRKILDTELQPVPLILKHLLDKLKINDKNYADMPIEWILKTEITKRKGELKKSYSAVETLWQQLHINDNEEDKSRNERLLNLANELYRKPETNWLTEQDIQKRKTAFTAAWNEAEKIINDYMKELPENLVNILCEAENYQLLPAFLDYCRSTAETSIKYHNIRTFDDMSHNFISKITNSLNCNMPMKEIKDTLKYLVSEFVSILRKTPPVNKSLDNYITPVKNVTEYRECIRNWTEHPNKYEVIGKWLVIGNSAISFNSAILYCIIRTAQKLHPHEHISGEELVKIVLGCCHPSSDTEPADDKKVLYSLMKYNSNKKLKKELSLPGDDTSSLERFVLQYLRKALYNSLKTEKYIKEETDFTPDIKCGFLDGSQCASISVLTAEQLRKNGLSLEDNKRIKIKAESVLDADEKNNNSITDRIRENISVELNGFDSSYEYKVRIIDDDKLEFKDKVLWLYSVRFNVTLSSPELSQKEIEIAHGAVSRLRLPYNKSQNISDGYEDIAKEPVSVTAVIDKNTAVSDENSNAQDNENTNENTKEKTPEEISCVEFRKDAPLRKFVWGYKKYISEVKEG